MNSQERRKVHGRSVIELELRRPGDNDLLAHTLYHFLYLPEGWSRLGPRSALPPERFLAALAERGWKAPRHVRFVEFSWWDEPRCSVLLQAHDLGYYPRYALLVEKAGNVEVRGTAWVTERGRRLAADVGGFRVVVLPTDGALEVKTAHSSPVIQPGTGSLTFRLGDIAARHRRDSSGAASSSEEGVVLPDGETR
jgi:hypothetical protein